MAHQTVADALIDYLGSRGVRHIFGVLAHTLFPIGDAIARRPEIKFVNAQHEGGAGNMDCTTITGLPGMYLRKVLTTARVRRSAEPAGGPPRTTLIVLSW